MNGKKLGPSGKLYYTYSYLRGKSLKKKKEASIQEADLEDENELINESKILIITW